MRVTAMSLMSPMRRSLQIRSIAKGRFSSTQQVGEAPKPVSPHIGFYKTFARPIAKVLLMATFTYQFTYWLWVKMEKDEIKQERQHEIRKLEEELEAAVAKKQ